MQLSGYYKFREVSLKGIFVIDFLIKVALALRGKTRLKFCGLML